MKDCLFCKIIKGEIPCVKIYENNQVLCFLDINPVTRGHSLVVPKKHSADILEIGEEELKEMSKLLPKISRALKKATGAKGINLMMSNGEEAGQVVMHSHLHLIPRFEDDGLELWSGEQAKPEELEKRGKEIIQEVAKEMEKGEKQ